MADKIPECNVTHMFLTGTASDVKKEECEGDDDKVYVSETVIMNIKEELAPSEGLYTVINDNIKIEKELDANNIKIEFHNGLLYCERCQAHYEDYCIKCGMLIHILNRNAMDNSHNKIQEELPSGILEIQHLIGHLGILALKVIPEGVKFGPFTGLCRTECAWKIKGGKFVVDMDRSRYGLNWMQYINPARNSSEGNLIVLQCEDNLYYRSTRQIQAGEELLVYFGKEFELSLNENVEVDFIPTMENMIRDVFACTFCSLGFSSKSHLAKHKTICLEGAGSDFSLEGMTTIKSFDKLLKPTDFI